jgi:hypothetical protein
MGYHLPAQQDTRLNYSPASWEGSDSLYPSPHFQIAPDSTKPAETHLENVYLQNQPHPSALSRSRIDCQDSAHPPLADRERCSASECIGAIPKVTGDPDPEMICTSHVERSNLSMRRFSGE